VGDARLFEREPEEAEATAVNWITRVDTEHRPRRRYVLFSGGDDSLVLLHAATRLFDFDGVVHVNTGTGIPETTAFVHRMCDRWNLVLHELHPPESFEQVFIEEPIINGLPGPGMHHIAYSRLKERALRAFVQREKERWRDRIMFVTGIRADESEKRMGYGDSVIDRDGATVWVNPLYDWYDDEMRSYRERSELPRNPVAEHLHLSGECLCGSFAKPGELAQIEFFYPDVAARIRGWERLAEARGLTYCRWGNKRPDGTATAVPKLCKDCPTRLFDPEETS
jgi:3'-phosphoadenosine 5'-phosphosulfate sulfotransferase (PAPS reductase)/FAD synthetase